MAKMKKWYSLFTFCFNVSLKCLMFFCLILFWVTCFVMFCCFHVPNNNFPAQYWYSSDVYWLLCYFASTFQLSGKYSFFIDFSIPQHMKHENFRCSSIFSFVASIHDLLLFLFVKFVRCIFSHMKVQVFFNIQLCWWTFDNLYLSVCFPFNVTLWNLFVYIFWRFDSLNFQDCWMQ